MGYGMICTVYFSWKLLSVSLCLSLYMVETTFPKYCHCVQIIAGTQWILITCFGKCNSIIVNFLSTSCSKDKWHVSDVFVVVTYCICFFVFRAWNLRVFLGEHLHVPMELWEKIGYVKMATSRLFFRWLYCIGFSRDVQTHSDLISDSVCI